MPKQLSEGKEKTSHESDNPADVVYTVTWDGEATVPWSSSNPKLTVAVFPCLVAVSVLASFIFKL